MVAAEFHANFNTPEQTLQALTGKEISYLSRQRSLFADPSAKYPAGTEVLIIDMFGDENIDHIQALATGARSQEIPVLLTMSDIDPMYTDKHIPNILQLTGARGVLNRDDLLSGDDPSEIINQALLQSQHVAA